MVSPVQKKKRKERKKERKKNKKKEGKSKERKRARSGAAKPTFHDFWDCWSPPGPTPPKACPWQGWSE
ncbi:hypothetical protein VTK26DRAFT_7318 [Humicola hyalothermophila]